MQPRRGTWGRLAGSRPLSSARGEHGQVASTPHRSSHRFARGGGGAGWYRGSGRNGGLQTLAPTFSKFQVDTPPVNKRRQKGQKRVQTGQQWVQKGQDKYTRSSNEYRWDICEQKGDSMHLA
jgi:hypothetical protein